MGTGLQRAYAATHGLELGATYRAAGGRQAESRTLVSVEKTEKGTLFAHFRHWGNAMSKCRLATFAKWAKAAERVEAPEMAAPHLAEL